MRVAMPIPLILVALAICTSPVEGSSFTIDDWDLTIGVISTWPDIVGDSFHDVENPFHESHSVALGLSTASASYDFAWAEEFGTFIIEGAHEAEDSSGLHLEALSNGWIYLEPTVDLTFTIDAAYTYDLPVNPMMATLRVRVRDVDTHETFFFDSQHDDTFDGQPAAGTFTIQGEAVLPAGCNCSIHYSTQLDTYGSSGALAAGSGYVDFQITPEPSSLSLLVLGCLGFLRRPRRR